MANILKEAGNAIAKALGSAPKPCLPRSEREAAHNARVRAHQAKRDEAQERARLMRDSVGVEYESKLVEIERARVAELEPELARIADRFCTREEKQAMRDEASQRISSTAEKKRRAAEAEHERRLAEIPAEVEPVVRDCDRCVAEAEKAYAEGEREVRKTLLADFYAAVTPAIEAWVEVPVKAKAEPIARAFWDHNVRAKRELGGELMPELIAIAFANVLGADKPGIVNRLGGELDHYMPITKAAYAFVKSLEEGVGEINKNLHLLNDAVEELVAKAGEPNENLVRRYAVRKTCATSGDLVRALQAFDKEEARKAQEASLKGYRPTKLVAYKGDRTVIEYEDGGVEESYEDGRRVVVRKAGPQPIDASA